MCLTSIKVKFKLHIIIFNVKHNRETTITLELETGKGGGVGDVT